MAHADNLTDQIAILYEDADIIVVNKPSGLLVHPSGKPGQPNVVEHLQLLKNDPELRLVHRLDRLTSGVLLLARSAHMAKRYGELFATGSLRKTYLAEVRGEFLQASGTINQQLGPDEASEVKIRRKIVEIGESAETKFRCLEATSDRSLLLLFPHTGRRHQLRVHMAAMGHAIINDPIYDLGDAYYLALRYSEIIAAPMHLHAWKLEITSHTGAVQLFEAPLPPFAPASFYTHN
jgi:RluA family pseudouridine synthase